MSTDTSRTATDRGVAVPATPMQEALWWVHQRAQDKSVYTITWRLACSRPVDADALRAAWQAVVDAHEALRTSVVRSGARVELVPHPRVEARFRRVEVEAAGDADADVLLRLLAEEVHASGIPLTSESLAALTLVRVGDRHQVLLTVHHVVVDGWALHLVVEELSAAYAAACAGEPPAAPAEEFPFGDYAREQADEDTAARWRADLDHWRTTLEGATASTIAAAVDADFVPGAPGTVVRHTFSAHASAAVETLARSAYALPFATFQAAMHIVLARGGAGPDVAIGAVVANRVSARDQALVGYTANLCISRGHVVDTDRVVDVVTRARDRVWAMLAHQAAPYSLVLSSLSAGTRRALTEDLPLGLSHLGPIGSELRLGDVGLTLLPSPNRAARADISISTWEDDGYHAEIEYNTDRYDAATIETLLEDLDAVLAVCGREPDRAVGTVDVRSRAVVAHLDHARVGGSADAPELPASPEWDRLVGAWSQLLGSPPAGPDVDFFAAGGTSLGLLRLTSELEAATGATLDAVAWLGEPTPRRLLAQLVDDGAAPDAGPASTVVTLRAGDGPHVHLLHGAGGGPGDFRDVVAALPDGWRVTASRELEPADSVPAMARRYQADLDAAGEQPDVLCGWSLGGLVAYAMADGIAREQPAPPALVLLDAPPPTGWAPEPEADLFDGFAASFLGSLGDAASSLPSVTGNAGDAEIRTRALAACLAAHGQEVPADALARRWSDYARHARMGERYVGPDHVITPALVVAADLRDVDVRQWEQRLAASRHLRVDADHHGVLRGATAAQVAAELETFGRTLDLENTRGTGNARCSTPTSC